MGFRAETCAIYKGKKFRFRFFFLHINKVHIHKSNYTEFYAIMLKNIAAMAHLPKQTTSYSCDVIVKTTIT